METMYDKAYNEWDDMTVEERMSWCKRNEAECDIAIASMDAYELSEKHYCFWTTIREILIEE